MRKSAQKVISATRALHATLSTRPYEPPFAQRSFHATRLVQGPRHRTFFTSNPALQQNDHEKEQPLTASSQEGGSSLNNEKAAQDEESKQVDENKHVGPAGDQPVTATPTATAAKQTNSSKRRAPVKNSLRRVALVAQKGRLPRSPAKRSSPEDSRPSVSSAAAATFTISAVCMAEAFDMDRVASILQAQGFLVDPDKTGFDMEDVVHARGLGGGDVLVFGSGTVVTWSLSSETADQLATRTLLPAAEGASLSHKEVEDLDFVVDNEAAESHVDADGVVILGRKGLDAREMALNKIAISSGLARSTKLGMLENSLDRYLESTRHIPDQLSSGAGLDGLGSGPLSQKYGPLSRELILQKTGELLNLRSQLNHYNDLTDSLPDMLWDSEARLETYYSAIGKALNVNIRIRTLNTKLTYAQEVIKAAQEVVNISERISSEKHGTRLEWIIIILIAIEVGFGIRHIYRDNEEEILDEIARIRGVVERMAAKGVERVGEGTSQRVSR